MAPAAVRRRQTLGLQGGERGDALEGVAWSDASRPQTSSPKLVLITTQRDRLILRAPSCLVSTLPPPARCATAAGPRRYIYGPLSNDRRCRCRENGLNAGGRAPNAEVGLTQRGVHTDRSSTTHGCHPLQVSSSLYGFVTRRSCWTRVLQRTRRDRCFCRMLQRFHKLTPPCPGATSIVHSASIGKRAHDGCGRCHGGVYVGYV